MTLGHELRNSITTNKVKPDAQGKHNPAQKVEKEKAYIESIYVVPSHYCRKNARDCICLLKLETLLPCETIVKTIRK